MLVFLHVSEYGCNHRLRGWIVVVECKIPILEEER